MVDIGISNPLRVIHNAVEAVFESSSAFQNVFGKGARFRYLFFEDISDLHGIQPGDTPFAYIVLKDAQIVGHGTSSSTLISTVYEITLVASGYESLLDALWAVAVAVTSFQRNTKDLTLSLAFKASTSDAVVRFHHSLLKSAVCTLEVSAAVRTEDATI